MKIRVKKRHIQKGERDDCNWCPIAIAIREQTGLNLEVHQRHVLFAGAVITLSRRAYRAQKRFDAGKDIKPFVFELPLEGELEGDIRCLWI